jgi:hypothetical protein
VASGLLPIEGDALWRHSRVVDHHRPMDFAAVVRTSLESGNSPDQVAKALIEDHHLLPISAIKALRSGSNMSSVEAKEVIIRHLSAEGWAAAEGLWELLAPGGSTSDGDG